MRLCVGGRRHEWRMGGRLPPPTRVRGAQRCALPWIKTWQTRPPIYVIINDLPTALVSLYSFRPANMVQIIFRSAADKWLLYQQAASCSCKLSLGSRIAMRICYLTASPGAHVVLHLLQVLLSPPHEACTSAVTWPVNGALMDLLYNYACLVEYRMEWSKKFYAPT